MLGCVETEGKLVTQYFLQLYNQYKSALSHQTVSSQGGKQRHAKVYGQLPLPRDPQCKVRVERERDRGKQKTSSIHVALWG